MRSSNKRIDTKSMDMLHNYLEVYFNSNLLIDPTSGLERLPSNFTIKEC